MTLDLHEIAVSGPALPEPFLRFELEGVLARSGRLSPATGRALSVGWDAVRNQLLDLGGIGGRLRVHNHVIAPLASPLGYGPAIRQDEVVTREGLEEGGWLLSSSSGVRLRAWSLAVGTNLDAPHRGGRAYRFSPTRSAQRVLLASGERAGLLTDGESLRLLLCDPAGPDSHAAIPLSGSLGWRAQRLPPDSYRVLLGLVGATSLPDLPGVLEAGRLSQTRVTIELRRQAREAVELFVQTVLDLPANAPALHTVGNGLAEQLWREGLILVYRLLFILKLESESDPGRSFSFASTLLWRRGLSPNQALGPLVRRHLDLGHETGGMLQGGLRALFRAFCDGLSCSELCIVPLGGALFGAQATQLLDRLAWSERAVALLLDRLLWSSPQGRPRERVHYGALDVEDLGRVYEALLELEPGIAKEPMVRLRRAKLEIVVPRGRAATQMADSAVALVEEIQPSRFFLRAGLGRRSTGSYYTPHAFVRFLVQATLALQVAMRSPEDDPNPAAILRLKLVDPAVGSGHFLVEACRYLGDALYTACRLSDELASAAEQAAARAGSDEAGRLLARAAVLRARVADLPDADRTLFPYLPSRSFEGGESGLSQGRALAICRRLVAVHCLYGVDRNPLAVELAKLSLWLESYAEGLPLTFLDHRLVVGDSLAGPFFTQLVTLPAGGGALDPLLALGVADRLAAARAAAQTEVGTLDATVGSTLADLAVKEAAKARLDEALGPLRLLARAWSGAAMLRKRASDDEFLDLARKVAEVGLWPSRLSSGQAELLSAGQLALSWDLTFPEVFLTGGFDAVLANPPWDVVQYQTREFLSGYDLTVLDPPTKQERSVVEARALADPTISDDFNRYRETFAGQKRLAERLFRHQRPETGSSFSNGNLDVSRLFAERIMELVGRSGSIGVLMPSAFHANEGTTGIRRLYLRDSRIECCLSFENLRKLFEINVRARFDLIVSHRPGPTRSLRCAFYLDAFEQTTDPARIMEYDTDFLHVTGGGNLTFLELRGREDLSVAQRLFAATGSLGEWCRTRRIQLGRELHMTDDAAMFIRSAGTPPGMYRLHEGKTFHQFTDQWETAPRYAVTARALAAKPAVLAAAAHYRIAFRDIARASDGRTMIATIAPPGTVFGHTANIERTPAQRPNADALLLCALLNSHPFDWLARLKTGMHLSLYLVEGLPVPEFSPTAERFLVHAALSLCCGHAGFAALWREQLARPWRGPALADPEARWCLRARLDAVVAHAYNLDRGLYARVLAGFTHRWFPASPELCLAAFDALSEQGLDAFCRAHDPFHDVAVVRSLAQPVAGFGEAAGGLACPPVLPEQNGAHRNASSTRQGRSRPARARNSV